MTIRARTCRVSFPRTFTYIPLYNITVDKQTIHNFSRQNELLTASRRVIVHISGNHKLAIALITNVYLYITYKTYYKMY